MHRVQRQLRLVRQQLLGFHSESILALAITHIEWRAHIHTHTETAIMRPKDNE